MSWQQLIGEFLKQMDEGEREAPQEKKALFKMVRKSIIDFGSKFEDVAKASDDLRNRQASIAEDFAQFLLDLEVQGYSENAAAMMHVFLLRSELTDGQKYAFLIRYLQGKAGLIKE